LFADCAIVGGLVDEQFALIDVNRSPQDLGIEQIHPGERMGFSEHDVLERALGHAAVRFDGVAAFRYSDSVTRTFGRGFAMLRECSSFPHE